MRIDRFVIRQLALPLTVPYRVSLGEIKVFDSLVVEAVGSDGTGSAESTLVTGYTDETADDAWTSACAMAQQAAGRDSADAKDIFAARHDSGPFAASAMTAAVEMMEGSEILAASGAVPILAIVNEKDYTAIATEIEGLLAQGFKTLKVKVGWEVEKDLDRVRHIQSIVAGRAEIRIDANQGYSTEDGVRFVRGLDPTDIELVEQCCKAGDWDAAVAVKRAAEVPIMLDESIYGIADIDRAADLGCADVIKLKLVKQGGLLKLEEGLNYVRERGMKPVMGNGVAPDLGCWQEACIARRVLDNAGEMNGFLKTPARILKPSIEFRDGAIQLPEGYRPELDHGAMAQYTVRSADFPASRAAE